MLAATAIAKFVNNQKVLRSSQRINAFKDNTSVWTFVLVAIDMFANELMRHDIVWNMVIKIG